MGDREACRTLGCAQPLGHPMPAPMGLENIAIDTGGLAREKEGKPRLGVVAAQVTCSKAQNCHLAEL